MCCTREDKKTTCELDSPYVSRKHKGYGGSSDYLLFGLSEIQY